MTPDDFDSLDTQERQEWAPLSAKLTYRQERTTIAKDGDRFTYTSETVESSVDTRPLPQHFPAEVDPLEESARRAKGRLMTLTSLTLMAIACATVVGTKVNEKYPIPTGAVALVLAVIALRIGRPKPRKGA